MEIKELEKEIEELKTIVKEDAENLLLTNKARENYFVFAMRKAQLSQTKEIVKMIDNKFEKDKKRLKRFFDNKIKSMKKADKEYKEKQGKIYRDIKKQFKVSDSQFQDALDCGEPENLVDCWEDGLHKLQSDLEEKYKIFEIEQDDVMIIMSDVINGWLIKYNNGNVEITNNDWEELKQNITGGSEQVNLRER